MVEIVGEPIAVLAAFNRGARGTVQVIPRAMQWRGKRYQIEKMGLYHPERRGNKRMHIFSFSSGTMAFRAELDPESLNWTLAEVFYDD